MVERVNTGGMMSFDYSKSSPKKLDQDIKDEIKSAYESYYRRKKKNKIKKALFFVILIIVIAVILFIIFN